MKKKTMRLKDMGEEITLDEGYIITIEDGKEFLLLVVLGYPQNI